MAPKILCVGRNAVDIILNVEIARLRPDSKQRVGPANVLIGGQCVNAAVTLAGLGLDVAYAGVIGDDDGGRLVRDFLEGRGIDCSHSLFAANTPNATSYIFVDAETGERTIVESAPGPFPTLGDIGLPAGCTHVYFDGHEFPASVSIARAAREAGVPTVCDAEVINENTRALVAAVDTAILPLPAAEELSGAGDVPAMLEALAAMGPRRVAITMGEKGAAGRDEAGAVHMVPAVACTPVDTTGAGDAFHAGFLAADARGLAFADALAFGARVASAKCEQPGPSLEEAPLRALAKAL